MLLRRPPPALALALALLCLLQPGAGAGVFELQILEFSNYRLSRESGACCGGAPPPAAAPAAPPAAAPAAPPAAPPAPAAAPAAPPAPAACSAPCRTRFSLCLKEYQSAAAPGACSFGRVLSPVLGTDSFTLAEPLYTLALPFTFRWTRSFTLILEAFDDYNGTDTAEDSRLESAWWSGIVEPGATWHALRHAGRAAALAYRVRVRCADNYYNTTCTTFCRPRRDKFGHYSCDLSGGKRCLPGWQGDNCEIPVCKEGCHPTHGRCDQPGDCDCRPGWRGELCAQCQPYPGCKRGYCNGSSWDCTCDTNWGGILCDQDLNYCGTHEPCQHGGTCENTAPDQYLCTCAEGFSGMDCERVDNPCAPQPCRHGACSLAPDAGDNPAPLAPGAPLAPATPGFTCECERGWSGPRCDIDEDDCVSQPCQNGGVCKDRLDGFLCDCTSGWTGPTCEEDVDECSGASVSEGALGPCVNAAVCNNTVGGFVCGCRAGWGGRVCERNVDDCAGAPCLHGATCIDLVDDFHCACAPGWAGRTCARDVDDCASRPCRNGGECVDLLDAYRCICPVGFYGTDCEEDRDHCASSPCVHGACYSAQSDYYCHCAPGWQGDHCASPAPPAPAAPSAPPAPPAQHARAEQNPCSMNPCRNNGTCVLAGGDFVCICPDGYTGTTCSSRSEETSCGERACLNGGTCVAGRCVCAAGWGGARCGTRGAGDACASAPCRHGGRCVGGAGWWACECAGGWGGQACDVCVRPPPPARICLDLLEESEESGTELSGRPPAECSEDVVSDVSPGGETRSEGGVGGVGARWWGCNACWCAGGSRACTRLWCGLPDCLAPNALPCRTDEVCVPAAPALCLRAPCAALGECRRVAGRRVEPPALPAPPACWPGVPAPAPRGCARARLQLARERLARGAHVERACAALRRALAASLAARSPPAPPLTLICDLAQDDDDALDLAMWIGEEEGSEGVEGAAVLSAALRALTELVSRRRLAAHALLGAALRLRLPPAAPERPASPLPTPAGATGGAGVALAAALGAVAAVLCGGGVAALVLLRRRRATVAERTQRCDEEKSNNLQNEENLRRYANPLRGASVPCVSSPGGALYKARTADARNDTPPRDKELTLRPLPPPAPPPASHPAPPERLTVLV